MRKSGILLHITSLPSPYGIGTMGKEAYNFIDFLAKSGQSYWQVLPVTTTGYGDSPYQAFSSFAGNPYMIDLDMLCEDRLLEKYEYESINFGSDPLRVDYGLMYKNRFTVLRKACNRIPYDDVAFSLFCKQNAFWIDDYALFMSLKDAHGGASWQEWEDDLRFRKQETIDIAKTDLTNSIRFYKAMQFLFFKQWNAMHSYARENEIDIIGDLPIYVSLDSADVWSEPYWFCLDENLRPIDVAGCPPDAFTEDGQLWGNPLYNWDNLRDNGFQWWNKRIAHQFEIYDVLRIDHFRGFESYYAIPFGNENAKIGEWRKGPSIDFFNTINYALGKRRYIAEDLGYITDNVRNLLRESGLPGMKLLQFAFDGEESDYMPYNYTKHTVAYTGTHDNETIMGWFDTYREKATVKAREYMRIKDNESASKAMICTLLSCVSELAVIQMQDLLELGIEGRMNTPGKPNGNWVWRMKKGALTPHLSKWLNSKTELYGRK